MSLKHELKAWEADFKSAHGRAPTKDDIKQHPDIAAKYKQYNKSKVQQANGGASSAKAAGAAPKPSTSSSSANPTAPHPPVFKTPTKPRPSRSQPRAAAVPEPSTSSDLPAHPSPSKRSSASSSQTQPTFVLANSPSKLRALAALHSTSGSPNKAVRGADVAAVGLEGVKEVTQGRSPQKAKNPFASPRKAGDADRGMFGEFEKQERARMREKKRAAKEKKASSGGGVLGKGATTQGAGWGAVGLFPNGSERIFSRTSSKASTANGMDLDEVDSFFGSSQPSQPSQASQLGAVPSKTAQDGDDDMNDDDFLGPSPAKPSTSSSSAALASFFGLSQPAFSAPSFSPPANGATNKSKEKGFQPLIPPSPQPPSQEQPSKPKLFSTSLRGSSFSAATSATNKPSALPSRGLKRAPSAAQLKAQKGKGVAGDDDDEDALLDDADDSFYADALDAAESALANGGKGKGKKPPAKRKKVAAAPARRGKGKGKAADAEEEKDEVDDGVTVLSTDGKRGEVVLQFEEAGEQDAEERRRDRVTVHARGLGGQQVQGRREEGEAMEEDEDEDEAALRAAEAEGDEEEGELVDSVTLLRPRPQSTLLRPPTSSSAATAAPTNGTPAPTNGSTVDTSSLPADLASVLSLRASPQKKTNARSFLSEAKERQVARVLGEPLGARGGMGRRKGRGLLDLADEGAGGEEEGAGWVDEGAEGAEAGEGGEEEEDDDWDEEVDGWKETGEAMDGYYSEEW
ncbi:hypothetical protein JCM6882_009750 [Rhodosporidiobolus microsporus]